MAKFSKQVLATYADVSVGDYYVDSDGHWLTLTKEFEYMGGRIVHERTAREMLAAHKMVEREKV